MNQQNMPIAVFDSGLGGISVLKELIRLMPQESYVYYGDSQNAPYGPKSTQEVCDLTLGCIKFLITEKSAKAIVIACNTATSAAVTILRETYPEMPIIGIEPALKPAIMEKLHGRILVMATEMTLREKKFSVLLEKYRDSGEITLAAPGIVEAVEKGVIEGPEIDLYLQSLLFPYRKQPLDAIVLGCTHFPFVKNSIKKALGYEVAIYDGSLGTTKEAQRQLILRNLTHFESSPGKIEFCNSQGDPEILALCEKLLHA